MWIFESTVEKQSQKRIEFYENLEFIRISASYWLQNIEMFKRYDDIDGKRYGNVFFLWGWRIVSMKKLKYTCGSTENAQRKDRI